MKRLLDERANSKNENKTKQNNKINTNKNGVILKSTRVDLKDKPSRSSDLIETATRTAAAAAAAGAQPFLSSKIPLGRLISSIIQSPLGGRDKEGNNGMNRVFQPTILIE